MSTACVHKESSMGEGKEGRELEGSEHPFPRSGGCNCYLLSASIVPRPSPLPFPRSPLASASLPYPPLPSSPRYESYFPPLFSLVHCVRPSKKEQQNRKPPLEPTLDKVSSLLSPSILPFPKQLHPSDLSSVAGSRQRSPMICLKSRAVPDGLLRRRAAAAGHIKNVCARASDRCRVCAKSIEK